MKKKRFLDIHMLGFLLFIQNIYILQNNHNLNFKS